MTKTILVTGATGKQGGATITALLDSPQAADFEILAVTRNVESGGAKKLAEKGVKLVQGDLYDVPAIFKSAAKVTSQPIWGVFSVQSPQGKSASVEGEEAQGKALVDGALANKVKFFVYTSVERGGDDKSYENPTPIPHFISKYNIEHHLVDKAGKDMEWTILRPVGFMENWSPGFFAKAFSTMWKVALKDRPLQIVSTKDIGHFAAQAFIHPDEYAGKGISLAGDELTFEAANEVFKAKTGSDLPLTFELVASAIMWGVGDVGTMFRWFYSDGYAADIKALKKTHPGMLDFGAWLETESKFEMKK